jgi:hypothetical protein
MSRISLKNDIYTMKECYSSKMNTRSSARRFTIFSQGEELS